MLEIYTVGYNLIDQGFDFVESIDNYCKFADRVTIAINTSKDNTLEEVIKLAAGHPNLNVVSCDFDYGDYRFDGQIKDYALKSCIHDYVCGLDMDEKVISGHRQRWDQAVEYLSQMNYKCLCLPSINLCRPGETYKDIGIKQAYLHKRIGTNRGVVNYAKLENGKIDTTKSDTTEVVDDNGNLVETDWSTPRDLDLIKAYKLPYVFHDWAIDFDRRLKVNQFWKPHWENRAGHSVNDIILTRQELESIPTYEHGLALW